MGVAGQMSAKRIGIVTAMLYLAVALWVVKGERHRGGMLATMGTVLTTAPAGLILEWLRIKPDLRSDFVLAVLLLANATLVFCGAAGLAKLLR